MEKSYGYYFLWLAALIAMFTALAHLSCIALGPECYSLQQAPPFIVESAIEGTLLAPLGTIAVSAIFIIWALYAVSAAGVIAKLPWLTAAIYTISALCLIRGLLGIQLWIRRPELVDSYSAIASLVWFLTGLLYWFGYRNLKLGNRTGTAES